MRPHLSRNSFVNQQRGTYEFQRVHSNQLLGLEKKGFSRTTATHVLKKEVGHANLERLKGRVHLAMSSFGVTGVSLDGIKETADVKDYINGLVQQGVVTRSSGSLRLTNPKIYRRY